MAAKKKAAKKQTAKKKVAKKKTTAKKRTRKKYPKGKGPQSKRSVLQERREKAALGDHPVGPVDDGTPALDYHAEVQLANGDTETVKLTHKQLMFCYEYLKDFNAVRAAGRAGYEGTYASRGVMGSHNLRNPAIQAKIRQLQADSARQLAMDNDEIIGHWSSIGRFDIRNLYTEDGSRLLEPHELDDFTAKCISGLKVHKMQEKEDDTVEYSILEYKIADKHTALANRARNLGMFKDSVELDVDSELKEILREHSGTTLGPPGHRNDK